MPEFLLMCQLSNIYIKYSYILLESIHILLIADLEISSLLSFIILFVFFLSSWRQYYLSVSEHMAQLDFIALLMNSVHDILS